MHWTVCSLLNHQYKSKHFQTYEVMRAYKDGNVIDISKCFIAIFTLLGREFHGLRSWITTGV